MSIRFVAPLAAALAAAPLLAKAEGMRPDAWFAEAAVAARGTQTATLGLKWNGSWKRDWLASEATGAVDLQLSHWRWRKFGGGTSGSNAIAAVPLLRLRFDHGRSPWFFEGGIGLVLADRKYNTPDKQFSTAWNFHDVVALGRDVGNGELSLRVAHNSNAGVKHPNPGENFLQLRWGMRF